MKSKLHVCCVCVCVCVCVLTDAFLFLLSDGEDSGKLSHAALKNGHTTPIGSARSSSPVLVEEEPERSLRNLTPEEESKKRLGKRGILSLKATGFLFTSDGCRRSQSGLSQM